MSESALNRILQPGGITPVYQPVYRSTATSLAVHGVECLSRGPKGTNFEHADVLFDYVRLKREESLVDRACIAAALRGASALPASLHFGVNVHASTLGRDHGFIAFLQATAAATGIELSRITVEIVEHAPPWDGVSFLSSIEQLRQLGAAIALDDVGLGQSNFKMLLDVCPDFMKIDRYFIEHCATDANRQAVIEVVTRLAQRFGAQVVAEGVEDEATVKMLKLLGITLMQGFLFSEPIEARDVAALYETASTNRPRP